MFIILSFISDIHNLIILSHLSCVSHLTYPMYHISPIMLCQSHSISRQTTKKISPCSVLLTLPSSILNHYEQLCLAAITANKGPYEIGYVILYVLIAPYYVTVYHMPKVPQMLQLTELNTDSLWYGTAVGEPNKRVICKCSTLKTLFANILLFKYFSTH